MKKFEKFALFIYFKGDCLISAMVLQTTYNKLKIKSLNILKHFNNNVEQIIKNEMIHILVFEIRSVPKTKRSE